MPVLNVSLATPLAHFTNGPSSSPRLNVSPRKYTRPIASACILLALMKISSMGPLFFVLGWVDGSELLAFGRGPDTCELMKRCVKSSLKKVWVCGLSTVKSTG